MSDPTAGVIVDPNNPESIPRAPAPPSAGLAPVNWDALENDEGMQDVAARTSQLAARIGGGMPKETPAQAAKAKNAKEATSYADLCGLAQQRYEPEGYTWKIRVERTAPSAGAVKGIIGNYDAMSDEEFEQTFGGQKYRCVLLLEDETPTGQPVLRATTHIAEFAIPGPPKTKVQQVEVVGGAPSPGFPNAAAPQQGWGPPGGYVVQPQASQVDVIEAKAAVDLQSMLMKHALSGGGSNALERTLETQSTFASTTIQGLQEQVVSLNNALSAMRQSHASELATERTRYRDLDESNAAKVAAARDEGERIARAQLQGEITSANTRLDLERRASTDAIDRERRFSTETVERERESCTRRIAEVERARLQEIEMLKNEHDRAMNREKEDKAREVAAVTNNFKLQLDMIDRQTMRDAKQSGDMQQILLESKNTLITQLTAEKGALTTENAGLRAQVYVPFGEKLKEISATAQSLGFKPPGEDDDDEDDEPETPAAPTKSAFEQVLAALPQVAPMLPGIMGTLGQFAGIVPPPQPAQPPQAPQVRQIGPPPQPYVPPPQAAPVIGGQAPVQASPVISEPKRYRPPPSAVPAPEPTGPTPIVAPTGFVTRGPQPEQPGQIEELLGTLSAQAKGAITSGMEPAAASALLRNAAGERAAAYHGWIDAENALLLLERSDLNFWSDLQNREWFDAFWSGLGEAPALSLSGSLDTRSERRSGTRQALRPVDRSAPPDARCGAFLFPEEPPERENCHG